MELHICKQCGLVAPKGTTVCPRCGSALPPTKAEASRPRYTIHVDPDMVQYWDDEDEDEFPLKDDPFFMWYGGEQQEEMALALPCNAAVVCHPGGGPYHDDLLEPLRQQMGGTPEAGHCLHDQAAGGGTWSFWPC